MSTFYNSNDFRELGLTQAESLALVGVDDGVALGVGGELEIPGVQDDLLVRRERERKAAGAGSSDALASGVACHCFW